MPLHDTLRRAMHRRLQLLATRWRARSPDAAIHAETVSDTRATLRLWRWRNDTQHDTTNREDNAP